MLTHGIGLPAGNKTALCYTDSMAILTLFFLMQGLSSAEQTPPSFDEILQIIPHRLHIKIALISPSILDTYPHITNSTIDDIEADIYATAPSIASEHQKIESLIHAAIKNARTVRERHEIVYFSWKDTVLNVFYGFDTQNPCRGLLGRLETVKALALDYKQTEDALCAQNIALDQEVAEHNLLAALGQLSIASEELPPESFLPDNFLTKAYACVSARLKQFQEKKDTISRVKYTLGTLTSKYPKETVLSHIFSLLHWLSGVLGIGTPNDSRY